MKGNDLFFTKTLEIIKKCKIIPIIEVCSINQIGKLLELYNDAGFQSMEVKMCAPYSQHIIKEIKNKYPNTCIMAGTCTTIMDIKKAHLLGVDILVSPEFNESLINYCYKQNIPYIPNINSEQNLSTAYSLGYKVVKFYPADKIGGIDFLRKNQKKYDIQFMASGGLTLNKIQMYNKEPNIAACCTSHISSIKLLAKNDWYNICKNIVSAKNIIMEN
jgi:2-dehydro-3-deoxyphosphogluconate aldolase / (4S)-4-hydroxy-2-oxoglutarate aldolase